jgi:hypothetical protein
LQIILRVVDFQIFNYTFYSAFKIFNMLIADVANSQSYIDRLSIDFFPKIWWLEYHDYALFYIPAICCQKLKYVFKSVNNLILI